MGQYIPRFSNAKLRIHRNHGCPGSCQSEQQQDVHITVGRHYPTRSPLRIPLATSMRAVESIAASNASHVQVVSLKKRKGRDGFTHVLVSNRLLSVYSCGGYREMTSNGVRCFMSSPYAHEFSPVAVHSTRR